MHIQTVKDSLIVIVEIIFIFVMRAWRTAFSFSTERKWEYVRLAVEKYQGGQRLDRLLKESGIGWSCSQKALRSRKIMVERSDGVQINEGAYRVNEGDTVLMCPLLHQEYYPSKPQSVQNISPSSFKCLQKMIIYENKHLTILNKEAGYSVQGGQDPHFNLFSLMAAKYQRDFVHVTHRLDRVTSGVVVFAKTRQAAQLIQTAMEKSKVNKYYLAISEGSQIPSPDYIRCNIQWTKQQKAKLSDPLHTPSKDCITFYQPFNHQVIGQFYQTFLGLKLLTGRKHQIRCHLSSYLNAPILNDSRYGGRNAEQQFQGIYLHAFSMKINDSEILEKLFNSDHKVENHERGSVTVLRDSIEIFSHLPNQWPGKLVKNSELPAIMDLIQESQFKIRKNRLRKPNVSTIL